MFRCQPTICRQFTVVFAKVMDCYSDILREVCCYRILVNVAAYVMPG